MLDRRAPVPADTIVLLDAAPGFHVIDVWMSCGGKFWVLRRYAQPLDLGALKKATAVNLIDLGLS